MEFRDPWFLTLLLLAPIAVGLARRSPSALRFSSLVVVDRAGPTWRVRLSSLPALMSGLAVACLAIALARPRTPDAQSKVIREGIAIMSVIDCSGSMNARDLVKDDLGIDRLTVVKEVLQEFILGGGATRGRPDDLIGLISFAGYGDSLCPLTLDHGNLATMVQDLAIVHEEGEDGTAIGDGLALAVERLRESKAKSKVIVLLTDGVQNAGAIDPEQAAELAVAQQVKVYCIGAGTNGLAPFPAQDPFTGRKTLRRIHVEIDEDGLKQIADKTGGRYFRAIDKDAMREIYAQIDQLERTEVSELRYLQYNEQYIPWVIAALILLAAWSLSLGTLFRTLP